MTLTCFMFGTDGASTVGFSGYRLCIKYNTRESEDRLTGVEFQVHSDWNGFQLALQFDRFNFSDESLVVVG